VEISTQQADIGAIGLAVMGRKLALNLADHGCTVAVHDRSSARSDAQIAENPAQSLVLSWRPLWQRRSRHVCACYVCAC
jgi:6-phosphogluconate dehydrogenase